MPTDNINSQPRRQAGAGPDPSGTPTANILHAGVLGKIAMLSADPEGKITGCNYAALNIFGHSPTEVLDRPLAAFFIREDGAERLQLQQAILAAALKDDNYRSTLRCKTKSTKTIAVELSVALLRNGISAPTGLVALFTVADESPKGTAVSKALAEEEDAAHTASREIDGTNLILASPLMHRFMRMVDRVAGHTESVLITGETGTGKELIARTIHQSSHRRSRPWGDINCAALPENLVESELFG